MSAERDTIRNALYWLSYGYQKQARDILVNYAMAHAPELVPGDMLPLRDGAVGFPKNPPFLLNPAAEAERNAGDGYVPMLKERWKKAFKPGLTETGREPSKPEVQNVKTENVKRPFPGPDRELHSG